ncbi:MAG: diacylglycerol kinase family protein [Ferruginibacter sp.]
MGTGENYKILFVINQGAGTSTGTQWQDIINKYFTGKKWVPEFFMLPEKPDINILRSYIEDSKPDRAVAVGGDGTVAMLADIIGGSSISLGIIPAGSANGMAKELKIPQEPEEALGIIDAGIIKCCDAIRINDNETCIHISDIGLNAQLIKYFDEGKLRGKMGYIRVILKTLWFKEKMQVIIQTKGLEVKRHAFMVLLANASQYGFGTVINPDAQLDDGYFEVVVVRKLSIRSLLKMLIKPGRFNPKHIEIFPSTAVSINTLKPVHFQLDGEYKGKIKKISARVLRGHINFILPAIKTT